MVTKDVGILELVGALQISSSGTKATDGWTTVVKLASSRLSARSYYVFCYGTVGNAANYSPPSRGFSRIEIGLRHSGGSFIVSYHILDAGHTPFHWTPADKDRGMPFMFAFPVDFTGGAGDLEIVARYRYDIDPPKNQSFIIERPAILAIDRTTITEEATMLEFSAANGAPASMPRQNEFPLVRHTLNGGGSDGGQYLIIHGANITNEDPANVGRVWLDNGSGTKWFSSDIGYSRFGRVAASEHWLSQAGIITLPNNFTLRQQMQHRSRNTPNSTVNDSYVFAMKLHAEQLAFAHTPAPPNISFWGPRHFGLFIETQQQLSHPNLWLCLSAAVTDSKFAHTGILEVNGGELFKNHIHIMPGPGQSTNLQSLWSAGTLGTVAGPHLIRGLGIRNPFDVQKSTALLNAEFLQIFGMGLQIGLLNAPVDESQGPDLVIIPDRESTIAVGSLQVLPTEPSWSMPIDEGGELRELLIPRGDRIVSPRFLKGKRIFDLHWSGLNVTEGEALSDFFDGLLTTDGGTFAWTPPSDTTAKAFTLDADDHRPTRAADGSMTLRARIVELVFVAP